MNLTLAVPSQFDYFISLSDQCIESTMRESQFFYYLKGNNLLSITRNEQTIGFIAQSVVSDEAELIQIIIDPSYRGLGLGRQSILLWHDQLQALNVSEVFLEVRDGNSVAYNLYESLGYSEIGVRKNYYEFGNVLSDALMMRKTFY